MGQGILRDAFLGEDLYLGKQFAAGHVSLIGRCSHVESEEPGAQAVKLGGIDVVGQSQFFPQSREEGARHVGAILVDQFQGGDVLGGDVGTRVADGNDSLFLGQAPGDLTGIDLLPGSGGGFAGQSFREGGKDPFT